MSEYQKIASELRRLSKQPENISADSKSNLEKLATIALVHEQLKEASLRSKAKKLLAGVGLAGATGTAGYVGHEKGEKSGRKKGVQEAYRAALPFVRRARQRADAAVAYARRMSAEKTSSARRVAKGLAAASLPVGAYYVGKNRGTKKGKSEGRKFVGRHAMQAINQQNTRFRNALGYIMSKRRKSSQGGK